MSPHQSPHAPADPFLSALAHAAHLLPAQGPIAVFVHHNTLHAFEHLPFHEAVLEGERTLGGRPYLEEDTYRDLMRKGRIREQDVEEAYERIHGRPLRDEREVIGGLVPLGALRRALLLHAVRAPGGAEVPFLLHDAGGLSRFRPGVSEACATFLLRGSSGPREVLQALFDAALLLAAAPPERAPEPATFPRHRDALLHLAGIDTDHWIHPVLIRWSAVFLDGGTAYWPMPLRDQGFYRAVRRLEAQPGAVRPGWARGVGEAFRDLERRDVDAEAACREALAELGVGPERIDAFVAATLGALRGFAGMFHKLEDDTEPGAPARPTLMDFLAVRLTYERCAVRAAAEQAGLAHRPLGALLDAAPQAEGRDARADAYVLFQLFQLLGIRPARARSMGADGARALLREVAGFGDRARRRVWQEAYELRYMREVSGAIASHPPCPADAPRFQVMTCLDEREESFRRHIEETDPRVETFGGAGFFGLPVDYRGIDDAHATARCPIVVVPDREIHEHPLPEDAALLDVRRKRRRLAGVLARELGTSSRMFMRGAILNALVGWLVAIPMAARVLFPRWSAELHRLYTELVMPRPRTRLSIEPAPHHEDEEMLLGMPMSERVERVGGFLESIGLTRGFSPLVLVLGHGSTSLNNPLESAYDCGACGGRHGGPSARLFAHLANDPEVRAGLAARAIAIPEGTWFVGGEHDTCTDAIVFWDEEEIPETHRPLLDDARRVLDEARGRNARERCRRFDFAPWGMTPRRALREVERRAAAYDEPRPEYGHATNAFAVIGRRSRTRGLFLDRRAFLISYDPEADAGGAVLSRVLGAVGPVCAGINLEYYFSSVDDERYGCGTKLPHNITAGLGVMNGAGSDLRTGLARQMIELHEPVRLLVIVEQTKEALLAALDRVPGVKQLVTNEWIRVAALDPERGEISLLAPDGTFSAPIRGPEGPLPEVELSSDYHEGHREHLRPARARASVRRSPGAKEAA